MRGKEEQNKMKAGRVRKKGVWLRPSLSVVGESVSENPARLQTETKKLCT
jgi:hypothetical protein